MSLVEETDKAIAAAPHLQNGMHAGAVEALRMMARKIDAWDVIVRMAQEDLAGKDGRSRPAVPAHDNTSFPAYMRASEQLGLTPLGRKKLTGVGAGIEKPAGDTTDPTPTSEEAPRGSSKLRLIGDAPGARRSS